MKLEIGQRIDVFKVTDTDMPYPVPNGKIYACMGYTAFGVNLVGEYPTINNSGWYLRTELNPAYGIYPECVKVGTMIITKLK